MSLPEMPGLLPDLAFPGKQQPENAFDFGGKDIKKSTPPNSFHIHPKVFYNLYHIDCTIVQ